MELILYYFTLVLIRQQWIEGSVNIQTQTYVIIEWETGTKYIFPEMLLITICFLSRNSFLCTQNVVTFLCLHNFYFAVKNIEVNIKEQK